MKKLLLILLLGTVSQVVGAGVYKWVDDNGRVHYGERPPATANQSKQIQLKPSPQRSPEDLARDSARALERKKDKERERKHQAKSEADAAREKEMDKVRKSNCKTARSNLHMINAGGRVFSMDENGNRIYVSDAQRESKTKSARKQVEKWCQ